MPSTDDLDAVEDIGHMQVRVFFAAAMSGLAEFVAALG
jgi:hypothetical protein